MSLEKLRGDARAIFDAGLKAVDPIKAVKNHINRDGNTLRVQGIEYDVAGYANIYVIGMGKAAASMAKAVEDILGDKLTAGIVNVKYGHTVSLNKIKINEAAHPVPDDAGLKGSQEIIELLKQTGEKDIVICLLSGGGSELLPLPAGNLALEDKQAVTNSPLH